MNEHKHHVLLLSRIRYLRFVGYEYLLERAVLRSEVRGVSAWKTRRDCIFHLVAQTQLRIWY